MDQNAGGTPFPFPSVPAIIRRNIKLTLLLRFSKEGASVDKLADEFEEMWREKLCPCNYGFENIISMLESIPDTVFLTKAGYHDIVFGNSCSLQEVRAVAHLIKAGENRPGPGPDDWESSVEMEDLLTFEAIQTEACAPSYSTSVSELARVSENSSSGTLLNLGENRIISSPLKRPTDSHHPHNAKGTRDNMEVGVRELIADHTGAGSCLSRYSSQEQAAPSAITPSIPNEYSFRSPAPSDSGFSNSSNVMGAGSSSERSSVNDADVITEDCGVINFCNANIVEEVTPRQKKSAAVVQLPESTSQKMLAAKSVVNRNIDAEVEKVMSPFFQTWVRNRKSLTIRKLKSGKSNRGALRHPDLWRFVTSGGGDNRSIVLGLKHGVFKWKNEWIPVPSLSLPGGTMLFAEICNRDKICYVIDLLKWDNQILNGFTFQDRRKHCADICARMKSQSELRVLVADVFEVGDTRLDDAEPFRKFSEKLSELTSGNLAKFDSSVCVKHPTGLVFLNCMSGEANFWSILTSALVWEFPPRKKLKRISSVLEGCLDELHFTDILDKNSG